MRLLTTILTTLLELAVPLFPVMFITIPTVTHAASTAYPNLISVTNPGAPLPEGVDVFTPRVGRMTPAPSAAIIFEATPTASAGETVALLGHQFGRDTRFLVFGQTAGDNGTVQEAKVLQLDPAKGEAVIALPEATASFPAHSLYLVWAVSGANASHPVAVNRTKALWLGPDKAMAGQTIAVHGKNLSHANGSDTSWVYIKAAGKTGQWAHTVSANPYRVEFIVPKGLPNGVYEVWVHNGHGGRYGWSRSPHPLTVYAGPGWTGLSYNVKHYNAKGDGVADDTAAIQMTIDAAAQHPGATVFFPAGTYKTSGPIRLASHQRYVGTGRENTTIVGSGVINVMLDARDLDTIEIKDLKVDSSEIAFSGSKNDRVANLDCFGTNNLWLTNLDLFAGKNSGDWSGSWAFMNYGAPLGEQWDWDITSPTHGYARRGLKGEYLYLTGCKITGSEICVFGSRQVFFDKCDFCGRGDSDAAIDHWDVEEESFIGCTFQDYIPAGYNDPQSLSKDYIERAYIMRGNAQYMAGEEPAYKGPVRNLYVADNRIVGVGPHLNTRETNSGELILIEGPQAQYLGALKSAGRNYLVISNDIQNAFQRQKLVITRGMGRGQIRDIVAYDAATRKVTISPAWDVVPDASSYCCAQQLSTDVLIYRNYIEGHDNYASFRSASCGISNYGVGTRWVIHGNTIRNVGAGVLHWPHWDTPAGGGGGASGSLLFNLYLNNDIAQVGTGLYVDYRDWNGKSNAGGSQLASFGNIFRGNIVSDTAQGLGYHVDYDPGTEVWERNAFRNITGDPDMKEAYQMIRKYHGVLYNNTP